MFAVLVSTTLSMSPPLATAARGTSSIFDQMAAADAALRAKHGAAENRILNELFRPVVSEMAPTPAKVVSGALPEDMPRGAVLKNGPNPRPEHLSEQGGWLDGDGMVHCVVLPPGSSEPIYSRTWVRTDGFNKESAAGQRLFDGSLVAPRGLPLLWGLLVNGIRALQPQKDTANTGLMPLGSDGRVLALMEQCLPSELQLFANGTLRTLRAGVSFDGALTDFGRHPFAGGALTAHLKVDSGTGERVGVSYPSNGDPGARVTTFAADGALASDVMVPLRSPVQSMIHDCAITCAASAASAGGRRGYTLLLDLPMTVRPARMLRDAFPVEYEPEAGGRIGLVARSSGEGDGRGGRAAAAGTAVWCDVEPCVVLHTCNAYESADGQRVTLTALRSTPSGLASFIEAYSSAYLYRWVLDVGTGRCVDEGPLCDVPLEFPVLDPRLVGRNARYGYAIQPCTIGGPNRYGPPNEGILIDGVVKLDLNNGAVADRWQAPAGYFLVSEPTFVPRESSPAAEGDSGYLLVYVTAAASSPAAESVPGRESSDGRASRLVVLDAAAMTEAVAVLELPGAVPYGLHSTWLPYEELP